jgi:HKD family nuclease
MAKKFILQGITSDSHLDEVRHVLEQAEIERSIISVAFLSQRGFELLADLIKPIAGKTTILAGIRNGITSAQGLLACVDSGCTTYAVDTGSRSVLFHPKVYLGRNKVEARVVLGSANLTVGGMNSNIEASVKMILNLANKDDAELAADLEGKIDGMIAAFPAHVFQISTREAVLSLLAAGRLVDESLTKPPSPGGSSKNRDLDSVPVIELKKKKITLGVVAPLGAAMPAAEAEGVGKKPEEAAANAPVAPPAKPATEELTLVWTSNPLSRRPLNIPTGENTNPTGSMFFTKGQTEGIDQRHYFRDNVFSGLTWTNDAVVGKEHLQRSTGKFRIVIKDVNYGVFEMSLTHDSRTDSATYLQNNSVTQLHWGDVKPLVARDDLLDRTMFLYRDESQPDLFVLEID